YRKPKAVSFALNRVQTIAPNPTAGLERHAPEELVTRFLQGWRVDVTAYDAYTPHACHEEAELILARKPRSGPTETSSTWSCPSVPASRIWVRPSRAFSASPTRTCG